MMRNLDPVVVLIIICASLLAFVVAGLVQLIMYFRLRKISLKSTE